jgi:hypothetical protein
MTHDPQRQRKRKRLLVASVGVATISFMALHAGCSDDEPVGSGNLLPPAPVDASTDPAIARDAASDASSDALVSSGNLVAPPPPTSGNLLPPAPVDASAQDAAKDALVVSGNLVAPPPQDASSDASDAALKDGSAPKDARVDTGIPSSGNLLPPLGPR